MTATSILEAVGLSAMDEEAMNSLGVEPALKIGTVANRSGLPVKTIRYYDEVGLLTPTVQRSPTGQRLFGESVFKRLAFIKRAQSLGLTLIEIREILNIYDQGQLPCGDVKQRLQEKVRAVTRQITALETLRSELLALLQGWKEPPLLEDKDRRICPNIQIGVAD
ncbi:heavy metal-responsive transcriptional regulator [Neosynechococcus sphagnicola]|nr:heavy metal-responsive transcriptional regulator [Neosynechococcus sphagnicola]